MNFFIYGTVKRDGVNHSIMYNGAHYISGVHKISGYKLYVIPGANIPFITETGDENDVVTGEIYNIEDAHTIRMLRHLEGYHPDIDPKYCLYFEKQVGEYNNKPLMAYVWNREILPEFRIQKGGVFYTRKNYV